MSPALRDLESAILNEQIAHGGHPVLTMCAANAVVQNDPAGNRKLSKSKSRGRIDGMVALAMMLGAAPVEAEAIAASPWDNPNYRLGA
jgi:phage terminase large subunit-like protein